MSADIHNPSPFCLLEEQEEEENQKLRESFVGELCGLALVGFSSSFRQIDRIVIDFFFRLPPCCPLTISRSSRGGGIYQ